MLITHSILALVWILFCVLHSVLASMGVKKKVQKNFPQNYRYYRLFYTLFAAVSLGAVIYYQVSIESFDLFIPSLFSTVAGVLIGVSGLGVMIICIKKYFISLSGLKSLYQESPSSQLMIAGIHRFIRHPLYLGTFMAIWGLWLLFPTLSLLIADIVITGYTLYAIKLEEEKLVAEFGDDYRTYQKTVPKLLPKFAYRNISGK
jgi:methanethiol S-methyltransferase